MADDDDPVVREFDVFVCPHIGCDLVTLSHPLRPPWRPMEQYSAVDTVRMKPQARRLEVDLPLDTASHNYNRVEDRPDGTAAPHKKIQHVTLRSHLVEPRAPLAMGSIQDGKLLLTPLDFSLQLRPHLSHLVSRSRVLFLLLRLGLGMVCIVLGLVESRLFLRANVEKAGTAKPMQAGHALCTSAWSVHLHQHPVCTSAATHW